MPIVLTNDDGLLSPSLLPLWEELRELGEVAIVVPSQEKSASSHAVTLHQPLVARETFLGEKVKAFAVDGTPADCIMLSARALFKDIKLVISGINIGPNLGWDIFYSGTVGAAREGAMQGISSFSISLNCEGEGKHLDTAIFIAKKITSFLLQNPLPPHTFLNVNVPDVGREDLMGVELTRLGKRTYPSPIRKIYEEGKKLVYWIGGETPVDELEEGTDVYAIAQRKVSITPLGLDLTSGEALSLLRNVRWEELII
ncbi:5'/3'-nucleotidase SurE [bacterium]|nr:5'/3'-nucleotidase SurE [bacterium]